jgi:hypothetical protein
MYIHYRVRVKLQKHKINLANASLCCRFLAADSVSLSDGLCSAIVPFFDVKSSNSLGLLFSYLRPTLM